MKATSSTASETTSLISQPGRQPGLAKRIGILLTLVAFPILYTGCGNNSAITPTTDTSNGNGTTNTTDQSGTSSTSSSGSGSSSSSSSSSGSGSQAAQAQSCSTSGGSSTTSSSGSSGGSGNSGCTSGSQLGTSQSASTQSVLNAGAQTYDLMNQCTQYVLANPPGSDWTQDQLNKAFSSAATLLAQCFAKIVTNQAQFSSSYTNTQQKKLTDTANAVDTIGKTVSHSWEN